MEPTKHNVWYSPAFRKISVWMGRFMMRSFRKQSEKAISTNRETLRKILELNGQTEFGQRHQFSGLVAKDEAAYRAALPLSTYADYVDDIDRMTAGETNILTAEPLHFFAVSSGTTGRPKLVPVTRRHHSFTMRYMGMLVPGVIATRIPKGEQTHLGVDLLSFAAATEKTAGGTPLGGGTDEAARRMSRIIPHIWNSPIEVYTLDDQKTAWYLHALYALRNRQTAFAEAVFAPHLIEWIRQIESRWDELLADIENGTLSERLDLSDDLRERFLLDCQPDPERARELRAAGQTFEGILPRIWPEMSHLMTITSGGFAVYKPYLRYYSGELPIFSPSYGATESFIGVALWPDRPERYVLAPDVAYFEFIPEKEVDAKTPQTLTLGEIEAGQAYEIVLTNYAGLYRYRLGDVVRVEEFYGEAPVLEFLYRRGDQFALVGEHTTDAHLRDVMGKLGEQWAPDLDYVIGDYTTSEMVESSPPAYVFYVEPAGDDAQKLARYQQEGEALLDQLLQESNPDLVGYRRDGLLGAPLLKIVAPGTFEEIFALKMTGQVKLKRNQLKIARKVTTTEELAILEKNRVRLVQGEGSTATRWVGVDPSK